MPYFTFSVKVRTPDHAFGINRVENTRQAINIQQSAHRVSNEIKHMRQHHPYFFSNHLYR